MDFSARPNPFQIEDRFSDNSWISSIITVCTIYILHMHIYIYIIYMYTSYICVYIYTHHIYIYIMIWKFPRMGGSPNPLMLSILKWSNFRWFWGTPTLGNPRIFSINPSQPCLPGRETPACGFLFTGPGLVPIPRKNCHGMGTFHFTLANVFSCHRRQIRKTDK